jgi:hypothetical protein
MSRARGLAAAGLVVLAAYNIATGVVPLAGRTEAAKVHAAREVLREGDLVVGPGHGWDEALDLEGPLPKGAELVLLSFYAGRDGADQALARVREQASSGRRIVLVRFIEDDNPEGWKELAVLGLDRQRVREALGARTLERLGPDVYAVPRQPSRFGRR